MVPVALLPAQSPGSFRAAGGTHLAGGTHSLCSFGHGLRLSGPLLLPFHVQRMCGSAWGQTNSETFWRPPLALEFGPLRVPEWEPGGGL